MFEAPRTPLKEKLPLLDALRAFWLKGRRGHPLECVDFAEIFRKSLMLEQNRPTGRCGFSTGRAAASTDYLIFSTSAISRFSRPYHLYLSLLKKKERRKDRLEGKTPIHGIEYLPKKASTGFTPHTRVIRGNMWMVFYLWVNGLSGCLGGIHASTGCFAGGYFESVTIEKGKI